MRLLKFWGWGLVIISFLPWLLVLTLPWWPLANNQRLLATVILLVIAEVLFWLGALIVGKQAVEKYRKYFTWRNLKRVWQKSRRW
jgi:hypothetical protein